MRATLASYHPEIGTESRNSYHISALLSGVARLLLGYTWCCHAGAGRSQPVDIKDCNATDTSSSCHPGAWRSQAGDLQRVAFFEGGAPKVLRTCGRSSLRRWPPSVVACRPGRSNGPPISIRRFHFPRWKPSW